MSKVRDNDTIHSAAASHESGPPEMKKKKISRPTDPTLVAARRLDNLLAEMTPSMRVWAISWLCLKYGVQVTDRSANASVPEES